jgi:lipopolysaccharide transport system permease protein
MAGYEIKPSKWLSTDLGELWRFRELFLFMAWRDIMVKYKQTVLGFLWVILQPLVLMLIFSTLWLKVMRSGEVQIPYPLFAYSGLIFWGLFSSGISNTGESMISNANIIRKVYFPRIIIPASAIMVALFDFMMTLLIYVVMIFYYNLDISILKFSGLLFLSILITTGASFGLGLIFASATIKYRDFRYVMPFFLQAFFFISPVIYPLTLFNSGNLRFFLSLNPLSGAINLTRAALTNSAVDWNLTLYSALIAFFLVVAGLTYFQRMESQYSDLI